MIQPIKMPGYGVHQPTLHQNHEIRRKNVAFAGASSLDGVVLKNGATEPKTLVITIGIALEDLLKQGLPGVLALSDLVSKAKDPTYCFYGNSEQILYDLAMIQEDGKLTNSVRNIVLSSIEGDGLAMKLVSPFKD